MTSGQHGMVGSSRTNVDRRFIIYAGPFNESIGGVIALHRLCDLLRREGHEAYIWPETRPQFDWRRPLSSANGIRRYHRHQADSRFKTWPAFNTPLAQRRHLPGAIVVYPEVVDGNPLKAKRVVRWLLHRPGFHTRRVSFGPDDRFFFFQNAFNDPMLHADGDNLLKALFVRDDIYRQTDAGPRAGTAYLLRKGKGREIVHDLSDSELVDDLDHVQLAAVFNRVKTFISYDTYTMYSLFAAMCGCPSVVIPEEGVSKEAWYPDPRDRYGVAYGFGDLLHAEQTRHLVLPRLKEQENEANSTVHHFVERCREYFPA